MRAHLTSIPFRRDAVSSNLRLHLPEPVQRLTSPQQHRAACCVVDAVVGDQIAPQPLTVISKVDGRGIAGGADWRNAGAHVVDSGVVEKEKRGDVQQDDWTPRAVVKGREL